MPTLLTSGLFIDHLRFRVQNYRVLRRGANEMALELKGLKAKAIKAAANIDRLNVAYDKFNEMAPAHAADVEGLAPQVEGLVEDLTFAAQTLGNSAGRSEDSETGKEPPKQEPVSDGKGDQASHQPGS